MKLKFMVALLILIIAMGSQGSAVVIDCNNCTDCSEKLQSASPGDIVMLTSDISDFDGDCICFNGTDNVMFDGGGHTITGIDRKDAGVYLSAYSQSGVIRNFTVTNFRQGVYLYESDYCHVHNVTSHANSEGITILYGLNNRVIDCMLHENRYYDFHFVPNLIDDCNNTVSRVIGSGGLPIGFYVGEEHLSDMEFSGLCLCNVDNSTIANITIAGLPTLNNNGLRTYFTDNTTFTNITTVGNYNGLDMTSSNWNLFSDIDCSDVGRSGHGIHTYRCDNNTFRNVTANYGRQTGIRLFHSDWNVVTNATVTNCYYHGIYITQSSNNILNESTITGMQDGKGLSIYKGSDNLIYNNYFDNKDNVGVTSTYSNVWNVTNRTGPNILGFPYIGGNYWNDYSGHHTRPDGFGDEPHVINANNSDFLPLVTTGYPNMWIRNAGYDIKTGGTFEYLITCRNASNMDDYDNCDCINFTWTSSNDSIATLEPTAEGANVTGHAMGTVNITVHGYHNLSDTITQNVTEFTLCGDVNSDTSISISDVTETYSRVIDPEFDLACEWCADVNSDIDITISDVVFIYCKVIDPEYELNCQE